MNGATVTETNQLKFNKSGALKMQTYEIDEEVAHIIRHEWDDPKKRMLALAAFPHARQVREDLQAVLTHLDNTGTASDVAEQLSEAEKAKAHAEEMQAKADEAVRQAQAAKAQAEHFEALAIRAEKSRAMIKQGLHGRFNTLSFSSGGKVALLVGEDMARLGFEINNANHIKEIDA